MTQIMKLFPVYVIVLTLFLPLTGSERDKVKKQKQPLVKSKTAFTLPERDLIPEGITYDKVEKAFYVLSQLFV
jgi:hypothetical protein